MKDLLINLFNDSPAWLLWLIYVLYTYLCFLAGQLVAYLDVRAAFRKFKKP